MTAPRVPGKRGRLPQLQGAGRLAIRYAHEYTAAGALPAPEYPIDWTGGITDWGMLGNGPDPSVPQYPDGVGDCTFAGEAHGRMAKARRAGVTAVFLAAAQLVNAYLGYDHGQDNGAVIAKLLLWMWRNGWIEGFAPVDHSSRAQLDACTQAFTFAYLGVSLTGRDEQDFAEGIPWGSSGLVTPDPALGHCIIRVAAPSPSALAKNVTWGALQESTATWDAGCIDEAWAIMTREDAEAAGMDWGALQADLKALGGGKLPGI